MFVQCLQADVNMKLIEGKKAPAFTGITRKGSVSLKDYKGKNVVLYFYPRDNTPGCTVEAVEFTAAQKDFTKENTVILGVSRDTVASHEGFCKKQSLTIDLISDEDLTIHKAYGVWGDKSFMGRAFKGTIRSTFLINEKGIITKIWSPVKVKDHVRKVLQALTL